MSVALITPGSADIRMVALLLPLLLLLSPLLLLLLLPSLAGMMRMLKGRQERTAVTSPGRVAPATVTFEVAAGGMVPEPPELAGGATGMVVLAVLLVLVVLVPPSVA